MSRTWKRVSDEEWNRRRAALKLAVERAVYEAAVRHFEGAEHDEILSGNGHHAANLVAVEAARLAGREWDLRRPPLPAHEHAPGEDCVGCQEGF